MLADDSYGTGFFGLGMILGPEGDLLVAVRGIVNPMSSPRFIHCGSADCSWANAISRLDPDARLKYGLALMVGRDGFPRVAHGSFASIALRLAKCETSTCQ